MYWRSGCCSGPIAHSMKRVTPGFRASLGDRGKALVGILSLVALLLMIWGYRGAEVITLWSPPTWLKHVNNLLMLIAVVLVSMEANKGVMRTWFRNPMLMSVIVWAVAHLLVNGDLASVILWGGLLIWAVGDMAAINRMEPAWERPAKGPVARDVMHLAIAAVVFAVIVVIHTWLGYPPLG